jgi:hypothetical protein
MCQEGAYVNVSFRQAAVPLARIVNDRNQPVSVSANVEDDISVHGIRIDKSLPNLQEVLPSCPPRNLVPGSDLLGGIWVLRFGYDKVLPRDNIHRSFEQSVCISNVTLQNEKLSTLDRHSNSCANENGAGN